MFGLGADGIISIEQYSFSFVNCSNSNFFSQIGMKSDFRIDSAAMFHGRYVSFVGLATTILDKKFCTQSPYIVISLLLM